MNQHRRPSDGQDASAASGDRPQENGEARPAGAAMTRESGDRKD